LKREELLRIINSISLLNFAGYTKRNIAT